MERRRTGGGHDGKSRGGGGRRGTVGRGRRGREVKRGSEGDVE